MTQISMRLPLSRLTLGTVQLGQAYGTVVKSQLPDEAEVHALLDAACQAGITCIDTHRIYGAAEERVGRWLAESGLDPLLVSKLPRLDRPDAAQVRAHMAHSLAALGVERLDGYLVHHADDLRDPDVLGAIRALADQGVVGRFGASIYTADDMRAMLDIEGLSLIQAPVSVLDQRLARSGLLARAAERGVTVFARSIFTQGVLLANPATLPPFMAPLRPALERLRNLAGEAGADLPALAVHAVLGLPAVASAVVGVFTHDQLHDNLRALDTRLPAGLVEDAVRAVGDLPDLVLDPRQWPAAL